MGMDLGVLLVVVGLQHVLHRLLILKDLDLVLYMIDMMGMGLILRLDLLDQQQNYPNNRLLNLGRLVIGMNMLLGL
jgi:hypothetical protein